MDKQKMEKEKKISKVLFWIASIAYFILTVFTFCFWNMEGLYGEKEGFKVLQDYTKTIAQTNLSMIFGLVALLIGVAALNSNSITEVIPTKAEFISTINAMLLFIISNLAVLSLGYTKSFVANPYIHLGMMIYLAIIFSILMYKVIKLCEKTLGKIVYKK
ncbi:hypothetical protein [Bacillus cereus group sp. BfR-BA-01330]|uniref:hypothetical protein n=1 Tax=Bacillus cereus group sp. BfR-BA-01330 TaxID=2920306 RepID=UPI001F56213A